MHRTRSGFTLIELMLVIGIIAVLSIVTILLISPAQLLAQGRDSTRLSNMLALSGAVTLFTQNVRGGFIGTSSIVYVSIPDPTATSSAGDQCQGLSLLTLPAAWTYHCDTSSAVRNVDGTGWIPVALNTIGGGSPIGTLPLDPTNTSSTGLYYTYTTDGVNFELTAAMESSKYKMGGSNDVVSTDGGTKASLYETGTSLTLEPLDYGDTSLIGYWPLTEGTGTIAYDYSGNNATATVTGSWGTGMSGGYALQANDNGTGAFTGLGNFYPSTGFTVSAWVESTDTDGASSRVAGFNIGAPTSTSWWLNFGNGLPTVGGMDSSGHSALVASSSAPNVANGQWNQIVTTFSSKTGALYIDGTLVNSNTFSGSFTGNFGLPEAFYIGYQSGGGPSNSLGGLINNVRVYNRVLSAAEIQALYKAQN
jgi:prepilin-type N-terminal cleavage/methylation domain-containing protein